MGLFSKLFGMSPPPQVEILPDRVWLSEEAKWKGICNEVTERANSGSVAVLLVAQFPDTMSHLNPIAEQQESEVPIMSVMASDLSVDLGRHLTLVESPVIDIIVAERHPLRSYDQDLEQLAENLPCRSRLVYHLSLEDPLLKMSAGEWVHQMLEKMGMDENEAIESSMVSRQIAKAQQKIEEQALGNENADSAVGWIEKNFPNPMK